MLGRVGQRGRRETNPWWKTERWKRLEPTLPIWLVERLKAFRRLILKVAQTLRQLTREPEAQAAKVLWGV